MSKNKNTSKEIICGIYCIENIINNEKYTGQAQDIYYRWRKHCEQLRGNRNRSTVLQNAWNKYGEENFKFYIVVECINDSKLLDKLEIFFIKFLHSHVSENGYNIGWGGCESPMKGRKHTKETLQKMSDALIGENNPFYGQHHSDETKIKMKDVHKDYTGENHPKYGSKMEEKSLDKMSKSNQGMKKQNEKFTSKYVGVCLKDKKWKAHITIRGKTIPLGSFTNEIDAAKAYNEAALKYYGEDAKLNIINEEKDK